jgi:hypothetical protein
MPVEFAPGWRNWLSQYLFCSQVLSELDFASLVGFCDLHALLFISTFSPCCWLHSTKPAEAEPDRLLPRFSTLSSGCTVRILTPACADVGVTQPFKELDE